MKKRKMDIKSTFLRLTDRTYPHGTEHQLFDLLPQNLDMDEFGNLFIRIGNSDVMFTSHLDTATAANTKVNHVFEKNIIKTDGKSILGADDKAGVTIMLYMIENNIPGLYYFFLGEEVGCVGSKKLAEKHKLVKIPYINKVVSFDRKSTDSVITFQASSRCCSDKFAEALSEELNKHESTFQYKKDPTGVYTDSAQFTKIYPECTNISVGYYSEHTFCERQDIDHLKKLANAVLKVNWNSLPVDRDPATVEYTSYSYGGYYGSRYSTYDDWDENYGRSYNIKPSTNKVSFYDEDFGYLSHYIMDYTTKIYTSVDIFKGRIEEETVDITEFLSQIELDYSTMKWDGVKLTVTYDDDREKTEATRNDLIEYLPQLDLIKLVDKQLSERSARNMKNIQKTYGYESEEDYY